MVSNSVVGVAAIAGVVLAALVVQRLLPQVPTKPVGLWTAEPIAPDSATLDGLTGYGQVRRVERKLYQDISLADVVSKRRPVIIVGSPCVEWRANHWTPQQLVEAGGKLQEVYKKHTESTFWWYDESRPMHKDLSLELPHKHEFTAVDTREFLQREGLARFPQPSTHTSGSQDKPPAATPSDGSRLYYTGVLQERFPKLQADVEPREWMAVQEATKSNGTTQLWMGGRGVTAQAHYDPTHNFFYQLRGTKRFVMSAPRTHHHYHLHPWAHPMHRQSQVDMDSASMSRSTRATTHPHFAEVTAVVADLNPGDLLYVPPFWFHRVEALTPSVSVNVWSDSKEGDLFEAMTRVGLPPLLFPSAGALSMRLPAIRLFIQALLESLDIDPRQFIANLFMARYQPLEYELYCNADRHISVILDVCQGEDFEATLSAVQVDSIMPYVHRVVAQVQQFKHSRFDGVTNLVLEDYIESVVSFAASTKTSCAVLKNCF